MSNRGGTSLIQGLRKIFTRQSQQVNSNKLKGTHNISKNFQFLGNDKKLIHIIDNSNIEGRQVCNSSSE